jgi:UDPglucose 6-dehydrogenase
MRLDACGSDIKGTTICILCLTFKPKTDDMRNGPGLDIIPALEAAGAITKAYDPGGMKEDEAELSNIS